MQPLIPTVLAGSVKPLGPDATPSAIDKSVLPGPWRITRLGLVGDEHGDLKNHGGPEKALHQYPRDHYAAWAAEIGPHTLLRGPGAFGENLSGIGWTEDAICIGDVARFGSAVLQVAQGRQPCFKLDLRFGHKGLARSVQLTGRTGWYWRVLEDGVAEEGDSIRIIERPRPDWPLARLVRILYRDSRDRADLSAMSDIPELAEGWRALARRRIESGRVEDWSKRLDGPNG